MTYASHDEPIRQSGRVMRDYKSPTRPSAGARRVVHLLAALALRGHRRCPGALVGRDPTSWAVVPSLPPRPGRKHELTAVIRDLAKPNSVEVVLRGIEKPDDPRALRADHFAVVSRLPRDAHVLLVEDTWTTGGHAQSAALALRAAGAAHVSLLTLARWLSADWPDTAAWMKRTLVVDYDPAVCPWTLATCPDV